MNAIRKFIKPLNKKLIIDLPEDFSLEEEVEVIVLSTSEKKKKINRKEALGILKGKIWMSDDFDEPLEDFKDYM